MSVISKPSAGLKSAVYVLPNLMTTGNLFFGFFAMIKALEGSFYVAGVAILIAALFDVLDGRVARWTHGTSEFGVQYDSLCDCASFGVAPAFLMYQYALYDFGRLGWVACFLFMACGALRLARFNVQSSLGKASGDFTGLPIPMAAIVVANFILFTSDLKASPETYAWMPQKIVEFLAAASFRQYFLLISAPLLAFAMVSNIVYRSHKKLRISGVNPFKLLVIFVLLMAVLAYQPELLGFVATVAYALSGPIEWALGWKKPTDESEIFHPHEEEQHS